MTSEGGGLFLVIEGPEGAGKTTQVALLSRWMDARGIAHRATREPGGTGLGEALRGLVLDRTDLEVPPESELLLILAARAAFVRDVVRPALERGEVVVSDRYALSTLAYQGWGRGLDRGVIRQVGAFVTGGLEADLTLVLDLPVEQGAERQRRQGKGKDRFEGESRAFLERVRDGYLRLATDEPRVQRLDAAATPEAVHAEIVRLLRAAFPETFTERDG